MWTWPQAFVIVGVIAVFYLLDWMWWHRKQARYDEERRQRMEILKSIDKCKDRGQQLL
jgi:predicted negative regulator of RcsB-dependent stress response